MSTSLERTKNKEYTKNRKKLETRGLNYNGNNIDNTERYFDHFSLAVF